MERLTRATNNNKIHSHEPTDYGNDQDRTDLLGEYEDTELTPDEITSLKEHLDISRSEVQGLSRRLVELQEKGVK